MTGRPAMVVVAIASVAMAAAGCGGGHTSSGTLPSKVAEATPSPSPSVMASPTPSKSPPPQGFVDLSDMDPTILHDIRYYTEHNFMGRRVDGYGAPRCLLTTQAAQALHQAQLAANAKQLSLKVYDCYRPGRAGKEFERWATREPAALEMKAEFYPALSKGELLSKGWIAGGRSTHSRGSTVDLTIVALPPKTQRPFVPGEQLVACTAPVAQRFPDNTVDMGTGYDCFDNRSHTADPGIPTEAGQNRQTLKQLMADAGFVNYANEWWHYRLANEPFPNTYHDFPITP